MRILILLLFMLNIGTACADDEIFFLAIPSHITNEQVLSSLRAAAYKREWSVTNLENNKLRINLDHRGYRAALDFFIINKGIYYSDSTTYYEDNEDDPFAEGEWVASTVPDRWVRYLQNDVNVLLPAAGTYNPANETAAQDDIESKLEGLKALYDKRLITEEEYKTKRKEIISGY